MRLTAILLSLGLLLIPTSSLYAGQKKSVKLTTYYPAPYGEYKQINAQEVKASNSFTIPQKNSTGATLNPGEIWVET